MFVLRDVAILVAGLFIGFTLATMFLYPQVQNRYKMGQNNGYISGAAHVMSFVAKSVAPNKKLKDKVTKTNEFLDHKASRLSVVEINGVRTLWMDE